MQGVILSKFWEVTHSTIVSGGDAFYQSFMRRCVLFYFKGVTFWWCFYSQNSLIISRIGYSVSFAHYILSAKVSEYIWVNFMGKSMGLFLVENTQESH